VKKYVVLVGLGAVVGALNAAVLNVGVAGLDSTVVGVILPVLTAVLGLVQDAYNKMKAGE
jgi:hypothetical protein